MKIEFENDASYITARNETGNVEIRCRFEHTDCRGDESLDSFTARHGGPETTAEYLKACHRAA